MSEIHWQHQGQTLVLSGVLTLKTVPEVEKKAFVQQAHACEALDLSEISSLDTAGVAWLLCMLQQREQKGQSLNLINPPSQLVALSKLSGLESVFE